MASVTAATSTCSSLTSSGSTKTKLGVYSTEPVERSASTTTDLQLQPEEEKLGDFSSPVRQFKAGNIRYHLDQWQKITNDSWVLQTVTGLKIPFKDLPFQSREPKPFKLSINQSDLLSQVIQNLQEKQVIELSEEEPGQVISNVFLRPKPNNKHRMILDLNQFNNQCVEYQHFKMHNLETALDLVIPQIYMTSIDLSDAYFTVSIDPSHRKFLKFRWKGKLFQFTCLPNGLACAPRLFTRLLNSVFAFFRQKNWSCFQYIDDSIILDSSFEKCKRATEKISNYLKKLGFFVHEQKSSVIPSKQIVFLGFNINSDTMKVTPTEGKIQKITRAGIDLLQKPCPKIREVAGFVSLAGSYSIASQYGANHSQFRVR